MADLFKQLLNKFYVFNSMVMGRSTIYFLLVAVSCIFTSGCTWICDHPCCCEGGEEDPFELFSDWHYSPQATPEGMAYFFFPLSGGEPWRFDFPGKTGGEVMLPDGKFHVMSFNDDTSKVFFANDTDYYDFYCYCQEAGLYDGLNIQSGSPVGPSVTDRGEKVNSFPNPMWGESLEWFSLNAGGVTVQRNDDVQETEYHERIIVFFPLLLTPRYSYEVTGVSNLSGVERMCASLSGMASRLIVSSGLHTGEAVTLPVGAQESGEESIEGSFFTFGDSESSENWLTLYFWLVDGRKFKYEFDVSDQIANAKDPMDVLIKVGGIDLPESGPPSGEGAFDVTVDGWQTYIIDINS